MLVTTPKNCDISVKKAIQQLARKLGEQSSPAFENLTLSDLVASRLIATDENSLLAVVPGTDVHPEFNGVTIKNADDDIIFYVDDDEMYFTAIVDIPIATGHGMPWLFWFTYTV